MDLLEIRETLLWICRTDRILAQPGGSMLTEGLSCIMSVSWEHDAFGRRNSLPLHGPRFA
jgi:hypothetical protein